MNSARVHPEDSPDGYLPVGQVIPPLAPVIRALVQYRAALQRRSVHHAVGDFGGAMESASFLLVKILDAFFAVGVGFGVSRSFSQLQVGRASAKGRGCRGSR